VDPFTIYTIHKYQTFIFSIPLLIVEQSYTGTLPIGAFGAGHSSAGLEAPDHSIAKQGAAFRQESCNKLPGLSDKVDSLAITCIHCNK